MFFFEIILAALGPLKFRINSAKEVNGDLVGIALNLWPNLGSIAILMTVNEFLKAQTARTRRMGEKTSRTKRDK